ncbi:MAG: hypothetical protein H0W88_06495 [Parachlamydiaceae bacterium]|nr:hypothetical protein [Parachlamydiaceae bacterium]
MDTKVYINEITIENQTLFLILNNENPRIEWNNQIFSHLWFLIGKLPALSNPVYIEQFAEIANFYWKGIQYKCIENIPAFQKQYQEQVKLERLHPADIFPYRLTDYKIFDVSIMHEPKLHEGQLIYFTFNTQTGLPYRVVCPFPYPAASTLIHYQILPIIE